MSDVTPHVVIVFCIRMKYRVNGGERCGEQLEKTKDVSYTESIELLDVVVC